MTHIFLSYARKDGLTHVERLESALQAKDHQVWRDKRGIDPARDFTAEIEKAIEAASHVVVCITPDVKREDSFVRRELQYALLLDKPIYVARFDPVTLPPIHVINHTYANFAEGWEGATEQLCSWLTLAPTSYAAPTPPTQTADPFREYVGKVYKRAVDYLDRAVIRLIELDVADTPQAVPKRQPEMFDLLMTDKRTGEPFHTFADAFQHFNGRMLLLGEPGAGKTITLMAATRNAAAARLSDPTAPLPIFGLLAVWDSTKQTPLAEWLGSSDRLLTPDLVRSLMADGKTLLLLDGLDEMGSERAEKRRGGTEERYDPRKRFLVTLTAQLGQNHALVTCRITDYESIGAQAALEGAVTLQKLTDKQLREYLKDLPALLNAVETDAGLNEIARTPLLLSFFAFAFRDRDGDLKVLEDLREGALRDAIFNAYMEKRYAHEEWRLKLRGLGEKMPFTLQEIRDVLGRVAMENTGGMGHRRGYGNHVDNILEIVDFRLVLSNDQVPSFLDLCLHLQYLQRRPQGTYGFIHLLLRDTLVYIFSLPRLWDESLYGYEYCPNPALALGSIQDRRAINKLMELAEDAQAKIWLRRCAIDGLGRSGDSSAIEPLIEALTSPQKFMRSRAAAALARLRDAHAVAPLIRALADRDANVRSSAIESLGRLHDTRAIQPLIDRLDDTTKVGFDRVCDAAAEALERIGTPEALAAVKAWRARVRYKW